MSFYKHVTVEHSITQLSDCYRFLAKIEDEILVNEAKKKILSAIEDLSKVSEAIGQQLEERR